MEILIVFFIAFIGIILGWYLRELHAYRQVKRMMEMSFFQEPPQELVKEEKEPIRVLIEKDKETLFAYNKDTNSFMAQANSFFTLQQRLVDRYPTNKFIISDTNLKELGIDHESI